jgi:hypothetical protein
LNFFFSPPNNLFFSSVLYNCAWLLLSSTCEFSPSGVAVVAMSSLFRDGKEIGAVFAFGIFAELIAFLDYPFAVFSAIAFVLAIGIKGSFIFLSPL